MADIKALAIICKFALLNRVITSNISPYVQKITNKYVYGPKKLSVSNAFRPQALLSHLTYM